MAWSWLELSMVVLAVLTLAFGSYVVLAARSPARVPCAWTTGAAAW
jgi:hypothetical protein